MKLSYGLAIVLLMAALASTGYSRAADVALHRQPPLALRPHPGIAGYILPDVDSNSGSSTIALGHYADLNNTDPFGVGTSAESQGRYAIWMPRIALSGVKWVRMNIGWGQVEPSRGVWNWSTLNSYIRTAAANHILISGILIGKAAWNHHWGLPDHHLAGWSNYVSHVVAHTAGKIDYYEVWNEPATQYARAYAKTVIVSYNAAKKANPRVQIGLSVHSVDIMCLQNAIADGAKDHFDYIAVHPYEIFGSLSSGQESVYMHIIGCIRKMLAKYDPAKVNVPIWITEVGMIPDDARPGNLVKAYTMGIAEGFAHIEWFEAMGEAYHMGLINNARQTTHSFAALKNLSHELGTHPRFDGWVLLNNKDYGFVFRGAGNKTILVAWAPPHTTDAIHFGQDVQIMNPVTGSMSHIAGVELTNVPILVQGVPADLVTQALANKHQPFPWDGNYKGAKEISWTAGNPAAAKGLHQYKASLTSRLKTFNGSPARFLGVRIGTYFTVDPNFLSFTTTPITITASVCQKVGGHAGFNLIYESKTGWKTIGWNSVPRDGKWHTLKWKITDDEFVSNWGYNFRLWSDDKKASQYYIRNVTVTKDTDR